MTRNVQEAENLDLAGPSKHRTFPPKKGRRGKRAFFVNCLQPAKAEAKKKGKKALLTRGHWEKSGGREGGRAPFSASTGGTLQSSQGTNKHSLPFQKTHFHHLLSTTSARGPMGPQRENGQLRRDPQGTPNTRSTVPILSFCYRSHQAWSLVGLSTVQYYR